MTELGGEAMLVAGGTDLYPNMKRRQFTPTRVIGLRGIAELYGVRVAATGALDIGAMTSLTALERDAAVNSRWPALARAARLISTPPLRNMGTLGGNLCLDTRCNYWNQNYEWRKSIDFCLKKDGSTCWVAPGSQRCWAVSSSDTAPLLCAIGAEVTLFSTAGERRIPVEQLFKDDGIDHLHKRRDEILTALHLPPPVAWSATYLKLRRRGSFDFPVLGVAVALRREGDGVIAEARIVLGGVGSHPHPATAAGDLLRGERLTPETIAAAALAAARVAKPLDNTDFVLGWRKEMARVYVARALGELA
jgi:4-hydroxybenzoyl-CoA reductase subunit beta